MPENKLIDWFQGLHSTSSCAATSRARAASDLRSLSTLLPLDAKLVIADKVEEVGTDGQVRHIIRCHLAQDMGVQSAADDVASTIHQSLGGGRRADDGDGGPAGAAPG